MTSIAYDDIVTPELLEGAIENREFSGFLEDYQVIWCLLKKYRPKSFFEVGCNFGTGTKIIKTALGSEAVVFSLDLPTELIHESLRPSKDKKTDRVGSNCDLPFVLLRGDSLDFDFSQYPCEGYFLDGAHTELNVYREVEESLKLNPLIVILHDTDIPEVMSGLEGAVWASNKIDKGFKSGWIDWEIIRVIDTRISYIVKKDAA